MGTQPLTKRKTPPAPGSAARARPRPRGRLRVVLPEAEPVHAVLIRAENPDQRLTLRLRTFSGGGVAGAADGTTSALLSAGELFWLEFRLPGDPERFEFVVRLAHRRHRPGRPAALGFAFVAQDEPTAHGARLQRIERFGAARGQSAARETPKWKLNAGEASS